MSLDVIVICLTLFLIILITIIAICFCAYYCCECLTRTDSDSDQDELLRADLLVSSSFSAETVENKLLIDVENGSARILTLQNERDQQKEVEEDYDVWNIIDRNRKEASKFLNNRNLQLANKLFEINANLILKQYSCRTDVDADFHYMIVSEVFIILPKLLNQYSDDSTRTTYTIDTGKGKHSENGSAELRPNVRVWLNQRNYRFHEYDEGKFQIYLKQNSKEKKQV